MFNATELLSQARTHREMAQQARRVANELSLNVHRAQILRHADELEQEAVDLERQAAEKEP